MRSMDQAIARFEQPLTRYASRIVGPDRARDVVQDTFVRLVESGKDVDDAKLAPWLYAVCRNRAIDLRRRDAKLQPMDAPPEVMVESQGEHYRQVCELFSLIDGLPEAKGKVLRLRFREGQSYREISQRTGLTVSNIGVLIHSTVRALKAQLAAVAIVCMMIGGFCYSALAPEPLTLGPSNFEAPALPAPTPGPVIELERDALALEDPALLEEPPAPAKNTLPPKPPKRPPSGGSAPNRVMMKQPWGL